MELPVLYACALHHHSNILWLSASHTSHRLKLFQNLKPCLRQVTLQFEIVAGPTSVNIVWCLYSVVQGPLYGAGCDLSLIPSVLGIISWYTDFSYLFICRSINIYQRAHPYFKWGSLTLSGQMSHRLRQAASARRDKCLATYNKVVFVFHNQ